MNQPKSPSLPPPPPPSPPPEPPLDPAAARARAESVFSGARALVLLSWPYLSTAVMRLLPRWTDAVPTMGVDKHYRIYLNPQYVAGLKASTCALILAGHELQHVLGRHDARLSDCRDIVITTPAGEISFANFCHDLAINSGLGAYAESATQLRKSRGQNPVEFALPTDGCYPEKYRDKAGKPLPKGLISEEYARIIKDSYPPQCGKPRSRSCGSGGGDIPGDWEEGAPDPNDSQTGVTEIEAEAIAQKVAQAARDQEASNRGSVPGGDRLWATARLRPSKLPWRQILRRVVRSGVNWAAGREDYTYSRMSRRSEGDTILAGMIEPEPSVVLAIDTSGSMSQRDFDAAFREVHAVLRSLGRRKVPVFSVDAAVYDVQHVDDVRQIKMRGGGGTDMGLAVTQAARMRKKLVIVMTDGCTGWCPKPRGTRVVVCLTRPTGKHYPVPGWAKTVECFDT